MVGSKRNVRPPIARPIRQVDSSVLLRVRKALAADCGGRYHLAGMASGDVEEARPEPEEAEG
jgi:hypothetical protein